MKKNMRMITVSLRRGIALRIAMTKTLRPLIEVIVFSGLITLNTLKPDKSTPPDA